MAKPTDPDRNQSSSEILFSASRRESAAPTGQSESAETLTELRRVRELLDAIVETIRQLRSAEERAEGDALGADLRGRLDELSKETRQADERLLRRIAEVEAAVRASDSKRRDEDIVHRLRVAETSLVGLSDTVRGLERRLSERLEPIERSATSVEETTGALEVTAGKLARAAEANARLFPTVEETRKAVGRLEVLSSVGFFLVLSLFLMLFVVLEKRTQLFSELLGLW